MRHKDEVLRRWCEEVGRDEAEIERTLGLGLVVIRDDPAEARRVEAAIREHHPGYDEEATPGFREPRSRSRSRRTSSSVSGTSSSTPRRRSTTRPSNGSSAR